MSYVSLPVKDMGSGMNAEKVESERIGQRGPIEHRMRDQLLEIADRHFRHYGYDKTTVADLARASGVSPAYVYKFFESKQAIGEAVCTATLGRILAALDEVVATPTSATERLRSIYKVLVVKGFELFFNERKLHDIVEAAIAEHWTSVAAYRGALDDLLRRIVTEGRDAGEFERKTPIADVYPAIASTLVPFIHPTLLAQSEHARGDAQAAADRVANLVLRSLAP